MLNFPTTPPSSPVSRHNYSPAIISLHVLPCNLDSLPFQSHALPSSPLSPPPSNLQSNSISTLITARSVSGKKQQNPSKNDHDPHHRLQYMHQFQQELLRRLMVDPLHHHRHMPLQHHYLDAIAPSMDAILQLTVARQQLEQRIADLAIDCGTNSLTRTQECNDILQDTIYIMALLKLAHTMMDHQNDKDCLRSIHPLEVRPFLDHHVAMVINGKQHSNETFNPNDSTKVHKYDLGKIYAASIMQGYFLARVHQRFKLEKQLDQGTVSMDAYLDKHGKHLYPLIRITCDQIVNVIEHHVESIIDNTFRDICTTKSVNPQDLDSNYCNDTIDIQFSCIEKLILHALAFGTTLWDIECHFIPNSCSD